jgi:hypothetical protein
MSNKVQLSTFDRLLNLHQSVKLSQIHSTNKLLLETQISQNQRLNELNYQLKEANTINRQILQNQINEIKEKEIQSFHKALLFNSREIIDIIDAIVNGNIKSYIINQQYNSLIDNLKNCKNTLIEFNEKNISNELIVRIEKIKNNLNYNEYLQSDFSKLENLLNDYCDIENKSIMDIESIKTSIKAIVIPSKGFLGLNSRKNQLALQERNNLITQLEKLKSDNETKLLNHDIHKLYSNIINNYNEFELTNKSIEDLEMKFMEQFPIEKETPKLDSLIYDAAKIVVKYQQGSASLLQRKLKLGYNRAGRIIDQLEELEIIGRFEGSKTRKVLINDIAVIDIIIKD